MSRLTASILIVSLPLAMAGPASAGGKGIGSGGQLRCRQAKWTAPVSIDTGQASEPVLTTNTRGDAMVVWKRADNDILVSSRRKNGDWRQPFTLDSQSLGVDLPTIAMAGNGDAIASWGRKEVQNPPSPPVASRIFARRLRDNVWQAAQRVDYQPQPTTDNQVTSADTPVVAMNNRGQAFLSFAESFIYGPYRSIWVNHFLPDTGFQGPVQVDPCGLMHKKQTVAMNDAGNAVLADDNEGCGADGEPRVIYLNADGTYSLTDLALRIPLPHSFGNNFDVTAAIAANGDALALWTSWIYSDGSAPTPRIIANHYSFAQHAWAPQSLPIEDNVAGETSRASQVKFRNPNNALAVWEDISPSDVHGLHFELYRNGHWGQEKTIDTQGDARNPVLAMNCAGTAFVVFQRVVGGQNDLFAIRYFKGRWGTPQPLDQSADDATDPNIAVGPSGNAIAVWNAGGHIWVSTFGRIAAR